MSALSELVTIISPILSVETGVFSKDAPESYCVLTPLVDTDALFGDNLPEYEIQEVSNSIYTKHNYHLYKSRIISALHLQDFVITEKRYIEHEDNTGYYHYAIDVTKQYITEAFGIHSPSIGMRDEIGKNLALGLGEGFVDSMKEVRRQMTEAIPSSFDADINVNGRYSGRGNTETSDGSVPNFV